MDIFNQLENLYQNFKGEKGVIGKSVNGYPIYALVVKKSDYPKIIIQYSIHAREYITTYLAFKQIDYFNRQGKFGKVCFIPMLNPDGVRISLNEYPLYKANANGVDLNVNFDADWGMGKSNIRRKNFENYIGEYPFSEPETRAIRDYTLKEKPNLTISYHAKGQEIYYKFKKYSTFMDKEVAKTISFATGYTIKDTPNSCGGYKDWCIEKLKISAVTIEVGSDKLTHPIGVEHLEKIYKKNKRIINLVTKRMNYARKIHATSN